MTLETSAATPAWLLSLPVWCDACAAKRSAAFEREQRALTQRQRLDQAVRRGLVNPDFGGAPWSCSDAAIEALNRPAWSQGRAWVSHTAKNLYLWGGIGTGKTTLARACLFEAFSGGATVAETSGRRLCKVSDSFREGDGLYRAWQLVDYLLLDDVDKARWTVERVDALWELLDARTSKGKRTILTSNVEAASLRKAMTGALEREGGGNTSPVYAALDRMNPCLKLHLTGRSLRPSAPAPVPPDASERGPED